MAENELTPKEAAQARVSEIRSIALAEILSKEGRLDHWKYYTELQEIKQRPLSFDWLEAMLMVSVAGRIRPAKVFGLLNKLRTRRIKRDQQAKFEAFEERLRTYLYPDRLTNHGFGTRTFADLDHADVWATVEGHLKVLRGEGYEVFLNSGTLLGVVRDASLIEHDDDIDLAVILKAKTEAEAATEWKALRNRLVDIGVFDEENFDQPAIFKLTPAGGVQIDLFPAWEADGKFYVYPHTHGGLEKKDVLPLRTCKVTGHKLPNNPEKMLALNYGEGWKTPDPLYKFPWAGANERFAPFLEGVAT